MFDDAHVPMARAALVGSGIFRAMELDYRKFLAGDPKAVQAFVQVTRDWVRKRISNPVQVDSVVQAAIVEMLTKLRAGNEPEPGKTLRWIQTCANNAVRRELTRMRKAAVEAYESHAHGPGPVDMSRVYKVRRELEGIKALLEGCNQQAREILEDRVRGLSYKHIAKLHQLSEEAARKSVTRLRRQLIGEFTTRDKVEYLMRQAKRFPGLVHSSALSDASTDP
jgi:RNA polymerase sigma factor (sigma-70 family)